LLILNEQFEEVGRVQYHKKGAKYPISCDFTNQENLYATVNPLKLRNRFLIYNQQNKQQAKVHVGVKTIHSIIESEQYLFVKSAFLKIRYMVYQDRDVIANLSVIKKDGQRYYKIETKQHDNVLMFGLFLMAQAVRMKVLS
jgi:hypothetical protein